MKEDDIKVHFSKTTSALLQIAGIVGAVTVLAGGYTFYLNYLWKPKLVVLEVDFTNGTARIEYKGLITKYIEIEGDTTFLLGGDWGVKLGTTTINGESVYDRIELIRKNMVYEYLKK